MVFRGIGGYYRMGLIRLSDSCIFIFFHGILRSVCNYPLQSIYFCFSLALAVECVSYP